MIDRASDIDRSADSRPARALKVIHDRISSLDLRELFGVLVGTAGTILAVVQLTHLNQAVQIALILFETLVIASIFVILPSQKERDERKGKALRKKESALLLGIIIFAALVLFGTIHVFTVYRSDMLVSTYNLFESNGSVQPDLRVRSVVGKCFDHSAIDSRPDAWRCTSGNSLYDPCFSYTGVNKVVVCAQDPWVLQVTRIELTSSLLEIPSRPNNINIAAPFWALILANGDECVEDSGATSTLADNRLNYFCQGRSVVYRFDALAGTAQVETPGVASTETLRVLIAWN